MAARTESKRRLAPAAGLAAAVAAAAAPAEPPRLGAAAVPFAYAVPQAYTVASDAGAATPLRASAAVRASPGYNPTALLFTAPQDGATLNVRVRLTATALRHDAQLCVALRINGLALPGSAGFYAVGARATAVDFVRTGMVLRRNETLQVITYAAPPESGAPSRIRIEAGGTYSNDATVAAKGAAAAPKVGASASASASVRAARTWAVTPVAPVWPAAVAWPARLAATPPAAAAPTYAPTWGASTRPSTCACRA